MAEVGTDDVTLSRPRRSTRMTIKRKAVMENGDQNSKKRRTFDDFFMFCNFVLEYEEQLATAECHNRPGVNSNKPGANCTGESSVSTSPTSSESSSVGSEGTGSDAGDGDNGGSSDSDSSTESNNEQLEYTSDDDSWNLVTCFCHRPFAGRPMIECSKCQTWVHLYCAKIKKDHVPDTYFCPKCSAGTPRS